VHGRDRCFVVRFGAAGEMMNDCVRHRGSS
jgi:hypothetical protein